MASARTDCLEIGANLDGSGAVCACAVTELTPEVATPGPQSGIAADDKIATATRSNRNDIGHILDSHRRIARGNPSNSQLAL